MNSYWKYKHLGVFAYHQEDQETAGSAKDTNQVLSDWTRWASSGVNCPIYINGQSLTTLLASNEKAPFQNTNELMDFFKEHLFSKPNYQDADKNALANLALMHFHQAGLPFATNFCINNIHRGSIFASEPVSRIDFNDTEKGLEVIEQQTYKQLISNKGKKNTITNLNQYHARTITTSLINTNGITLQNLDIDCSTRAAAPIFDKRGLWEKICQYIKNILIDFNCLQEKPVTERLIMSI